MALSLQLTCLGMRFGIKDGRHCDALAIHKKQNNIRKHQPLTRLPKSYATASVPRPVPATMAPPAPLPPGDRPPAVPHRTALQSSANRTPAPPPAPPLRRRNPPHRATIRAGSSRRITPIGTKAGALRISLINDYKQIHAALRKTPWPLHESRVEICAQACWSFCTLTHPQTGLTVLFSECVGSTSGVPTWQVYRVPCSRTSAWRQPHPSTVDETRLT